ncbi:MAG: YbaN family protein [Thermodesulfobacteriota bacterium]
MTDSERPDEANRKSSSGTAIHSSRHVRVLLIVIGTICTVIGVIGIVLPLLPTTPFLLLAAACYARSSDRFYNGLLSNRYFGPPIREWRDSRTVSQKNKRNATIIVLISFGSTLVFAVDKSSLRIILSLVALGLVAIILSLPSTRR